MKIDLVCQLNFGHKKWGVVSVMMEGMYQIGKSSGQQYSGSR
jgi:hypothetical protein